MQPFAHSTPRRTAVAILCKLVPATTVARHAASKCHGQWFYACGNIEPMKPLADAPGIARFAQMFSAMGTEPRLKIVRLLLWAHPEGLVAGDIQDELDIPASTLSHHLDKLKHEGLVTVRREGTFLWYAANGAALQELLGFLFAECCTRNKAVKPELVTCCR